MLTADVGAAKSRSLMNNPAASFSTLDANRVAMANAPYDKQTSDIRFGHRRSEQIVCPLATERYDARRGKDMPVLRSRGIVLKIPQSQ